MASLKFKNPETGEWDKIGFPMPEISEGVQMELLWENASPTSEFAAQTIELNLGEFSHVLLESIERISSVANQEQEHYGTLSKIGAGICPNGNVGVYGLGYRRFTTNEDSIIFEDGFFWSTSWKPTLNNVLCVPLKIYGIKGVSA